MDPSSADTARPKRRARTVPTVVTALGGAVLGAALTLVLLRPAPVVGMLGPAPGARVVDVKGRPVAVATGASLRPGHRVKAAGAPVSMKLTRGVEIVVQPYGELSVQTAGARIEQGGAVIDATAVVEEVRVDTPAGAIVMTNAKVEIRSSAAGTGASSAVAIVRALQGTVRLEAAGQSLPVEAGSGGVMVAGRPPRPTGDPAGAAAPVALASAVSEAERPSDEGLDPERALRAGRRPRDLAVAVLPVVLPLPVALPTAAVSGAASAASGPASAARGGAGAAEPGAAEPAGTLHAIVELTGARPEALSSDAPACAEAPPFAGKDGRLAGAFVEITSVRGARPARAAPPVPVTQRPCDFSPPLVAVALGSAVELRTAMTEARPVHVSGGGAALRDLVTTPDRPASFTPAAEGVFELAGERGARAWVVATAHPAFAVTNEAGEARIAGLPPGRHSVRVWHPRAGERTAHVEIDRTDTRPAEIRIAFAAPEPPPPEPAPPPRADETSPVAKESVEGTDGPAAAGATGAPAASAAGAGRRHPPRTSRPDDARCRLAVTAALPVAAVCAEGGLGAARRFMKQVVLVSRSHGIPMACDSCHTGHDEEAASLALKPLARERLAELLATLQQTAALSVYLREQAARAARPKR